MEALYDPFSNSVAELIPYQGSLSVEDLTEYKQEVAEIAQRLHQRTWEIERQLKEATLREFGHPLEHLEQCLQAPVPTLELNSTYAHYAHAVVFDMAPMDALAQHKQNQLSVFRVAVSWRAYGQGSQGTLQVDVSTQLPRHHSSSARAKFASKEQAVAQWEPIYKRALKNFKKGYDK